jgi:mono/diheme cytochrome c family protein/DNA-binding beta-propeller fold protein YncE
MLHRGTATVPRALALILLSAGTVAALGSLFGAGNPPPDTPRLRRPVALALIDDGKRLLVANREAGTVAVLDTKKLDVAQETRFGRRLSDLAVAGGVVLLTDEDAGELVLLENRQGQLLKLRRLKAGPTPVGVRASDDGDLAAVACLWPRRVLIFDLAAARKGPVEPAVLDLPFAPRHMLALPGGARMLVADSFGGELALVDLRQRRLASVRRLQAHNIRGLALDRSRKEVLVTHQVLFPQGRTVAGDIRSGNVVGNFVRRLSLEVILDPHADLLQGSRPVPLGDIERGAADPAGVAETADGRLLVALAGVHELAIGRPERALWARLAIGARPTALALDPARGRVYVANTFGDSISIVDLDGPSRVAEVRLGPAHELRAEERGEVLFYDANLSLEGWYSCHSCHTDGHTSGALNDNFTDGSFGTPKRVLSLMGTRNTGPWAWNGGMPDLETQIRTSIKSTMQGTPPTDKQVTDLAAYLRSLPPPPPLTQVRGTADAEAVKRGRKVFAREKCATCHAPPTYTSPKTYDVGVHDELGGTQFNPPSLRGLSQGGPYFHDGRAATLEEVFTRFSHPAPSKLSDADVRDLLQFLGSL